MKKEFFIEQPNMEIKVGVKVTKETEHHYKTESVEQVLKDLKLETILDAEGSNGINTYKSKTYIEIKLNDGDILLFDESRGFYLPNISMTTVDEAVMDLTALKDVPQPEEEFKETQEV